MTKRHPEQLVAEQGIALAVNRAGPEQPVQDAEERQLQQGRKAAGEQPGALPRLQRGQVALEPVRVPGVTLPQLLNLWQQPGLSGLAADRVVAERQQQQPHGQGEGDDGGRGGQAPGRWGQQVGERGHDVVCGADGVAEQAEHFWVPPAVQVNG